MENRGKIIEKVVIDVSEQETERPKGETQAGLVPADLRGETKNKKESIQARKKSTQTKP